MPAQIQTTDQTAVFAANQRVVVRAGSRLWAVVDGGSGGGSSDTGLNLWYSDDDAATWTKKADLDAAVLMADLKTYQVAGVWKLAGCFAGGNSASAPLKFFEITSSVDTGTPGAVNTVTVDAGGANLGVSWPTIMVTATATNPRVWIVAEKWTSAVLIELRAWYAGTGATGTWVTTNFTNLGGYQSASQGHYASGVSWTVAGADRASIVYVDTNAVSYKAFTFDPTAATPTPGSATVVFVPGSLPGGAGTNGPNLAVNAIASYLVAACWDNTAAAWTLRKSVDGVAWSTPTGWGAVSAGRPSLSTDGTDLYFAYPATLDVSSQLRYRKVTVASDTLGAANDIGTEVGYRISVPANTGTTKLYWAAVSGASTPFPVRAGFVSLVVADTTPPGLAAVGVTPAAAGGTVAVHVVMPADPDVTQYEVRRLTTTYPAANRSDGTVIVASTTTTPSAVVDFTDTALTNGTRCYYRVFVRDATGNWNAGTTASTVPSVPLAVLGFLTSTGGPLAVGGEAGANPIMRLQLSPAAFEAGKLGHIRVRAGLDNPGTNMPPTTAVTEVASLLGDGSVTYDSGGGAFVAWPASGLASGFWSAEARVALPITGDYFVSVRVEQ